MGLLITDANASVGTPGAEFRHLLKETIAQTNTFDDRFDAEVWLVDMSTRLGQFMPEQAERLKLLRLIHREAHRYQLPPELVISIIHVESGFDRYAVSPAGAQGLMQIMPFWKHELGTIEDNLTRIETNLYYGCAILTTYLKLEKGNLTRALARYNGSLGKAWYPSRVLTVWEKYWRVNQ